MRVHHLNCGTMHPRGGRLISGTPGRVTVPAHCMLVESDAGLVLVDNGYGLADMANPSSLHAGLRFLVRPVFDPAETAVRQVVQLGHRPEDVRHIVLTHFDPDHAGGLADFPAAKVHLFEEEYQAATAPTTRNERRRYHPHQWAHGPDWVRYDAADGEPWFGFAAVRELAGLPADILLVPLGGHTRGHAGIAVRQDGGRWLLHAGDAYFFHGEVATPRRCPRLLANFQAVLAVHNGDRRRNQRRLGELVAEHGSEVDVFCAHDPDDLARFTAQPVP